MGRKNVVISYNMLENADLSGNLESSIVNVINLDKASIHITWTGTAPVGEFEVQARNGALDPWYVLELGDIVSVSGNSGEHQIVFVELPFSEIRLVYDSDSGTGTVNARISAKVVGA